MQSATTYVTYLRIAIQALILLCAGSLRAEVAYESSLAIHKEYSYVDIFKNNLRDLMGLVKNPEKLTIYRDKTGSCTRITLEILPLSMWDITPLWMRGDIRRDYYDDYKENFERNKPPIRTYSPPEYTKYELQRIVIGFVNGSTSYMADDSERKLFVLEPLDFSRLTSEKFQKNVTTHIHQQILVPMMYKYPDKNLYSEDWDD